MYWYLVVPYFFSLLRMKTFRVSIQSQIHYFDDQLITVHIGMNVLFKIELAFIVRWMPRFSLRNEWLFAPNSGSLPTFDER